MSLPGDLFKRAWPNAAMESLVRQSTDGEIVVDIDAPAEGVVLFSEKPSPVPAPRWWTTVPLLC